MSAADKVGNALRAERFQPINYLFTFRHNRFNCEVNCSIFAMSISTYKIQPSGSADAIILGKRGL
jgi:hypothetical protein